MISAARAGVWGSDPVIGITGDYATNPALVPAPNTAEANGALLLDAPTTFYSDANKFSVLPSFRIGDAKGYGSTISDYEHLSAKGEFDTERSALTATAGVARDSTLYYDYLSDGNSGVRRDSALTDLNWDRFLTEKLEFNADASATRVRYGEPVGIGTLVDYKYVSISPTLTWNTVERNKYTLTTSVGRYNSLNGATESRNGSVQLGFVRQLSELWSLTASGGYSRALDRIDTFGEQIIYTSLGPIIEFVPIVAESSQNGSVYSVNVAHQGTLLLLTATASRQILPTGFAFLSRQQAYELKATYVLSPRWTLNADVRQINYQNPQANGVFYEVKVPYASLNASWQWTEHWTLTIAATHVRETIQTPVFNEQSQELTITVSRQFNHMNFQ